MSCGAWARYGHGKKNCAIWQGRQAPSPVDLVKAKNMPTAWFLSRTASDKREGPASQKRGGEDMKKLVCSPAGSKDIGIRTAEHQEGLRGN